MEYIFTREALSKVVADIGFVIVFEAEEGKRVRLQNSDGGVLIDRALGGLLSQAVTTQEFLGKEGESLHLTTHGKIAARNVVVLGAGARQKSTLESVRKVAGKVVEIANQLRAATVAIVVQPERFGSGAPPARIQAFAEGIALADYSFDQYKRPEDRTKKNLKKIFLVVSGSTKPLEEAIQIGKAIGEASNFARDLTNQPANEVNPQVLADKAEAMGRQKGIQCKILGLKEIRAQKMNAFLAVSQGSEVPPQFIHLQYQPKGAKVKVALVGKGITFDSGGLNIKVKDQEYMKMDMAGAAAVLGIFHVLPLLQPSVAVEGFIAACENMPSGSASRPGDIITARSGKTIEIINTDAEGRLTLADALSYASERKPKFLIDMATLTGGALFALGEKVTPILGNDDLLIQKLIDAGAKAGEPSWQLPLVQEYKKGMKKGPADLKNSGAGSRASTILGGLFLEEFVGGIPWVHMDIAGTAWSDEPWCYFARGATGTPVRTILYFLTSI